MTEYTIFQYALIFFAFFLIFIGLSFILSFVFGAPPVPSTRKTRKKIADVIERKDKDGKNIIDIGSGYGHMVFYMAKRFPDKKIIGLEISFIPYLCACIWKNVFRYKNISFVLGDAFHILKTRKLKPSSAIFYLTPKIAKKVENILPLVKNLTIANNFPILNQIEKEKISINDWAKSTIYVYKNK